MPFFAIAGGGARGGRGAGGPQPDEVLAVARAAPGQRRRRSGWHGRCTEGPHVLAIPGTGDLAHLAENTAAARLRLAPDELARLDGVHAG